MSASFCQMLEKSSGTQSKRMNDQLLACEPTFSMTLYEEMTHLVAHLFMLFSKTPVSGVIENDSHLS